MPILVHFEDEGTGGTLLVVFKMHGLQQQKTGVSIKKYNRLNISICTGSIHKSDSCRCEYSRFSQQQEFKQMQNRHVA